MISPTDLPALLALHPEQLRSGARRPVVVAVVDSGIDHTHPYLAGYIDRALAITLDDGRVKRRDVSVGSQFDGLGHGTSVAGVVVATAPNARLLDIRVTEGGHACTGDLLIEGFRAAIDLGAEVINLSLAGKSSLAPRLADLCERAYRGNQIVVAARRNTPLFHDNGFPADLSSCVGVDIGGASDWYGLEFFSGRTIAIAARGESIVTPARGGGYTRSTGTSFATPVVAGICALLRSVQPTITPYEVKTVLKYWATLYGATRVASEA